MLAVGPRPRQSHAIAEGNQSGGADCSVTKCHLVGDVADIIVVIQIDLAIWVGIANHDGVLSGVGHGVHRRPGQLWRRGVGVNADAAHRGVARGRVVAGLIDRVGFERLVAPHQLGNVLHRKGGAVDPLKLRRVVEQPATLLRQLHHADKRGPCVDAHQVGVEGLPPEVTYQLAMDQYGPPPAADEPHWSTGWRMP